MATKRKPVIKDKKEPYVCSESGKLARHSEILERTNKILYGNGAPKDGLIFRFDKFMNDHQLVVSNISDIKDSVGKLTKMYDDTFEAATTAASALEKYTTGVKNFEAGKNEAEEKKKIADDLKKEKVKNHWQRIIWIVMAVFALIGLGTNLYFNIKGHTESVQKIEAVQDTIRQEMRYQGGISKKTRSGYVLYNDNGLSDSVKAR